MKGGGGKGKLYSIECAAVKGRGSRWYKAKRVGWGTEGRPGKEQKWAIHWRYEKKYVVCKWHRQSSWLVLWYNKGVLQVSSHWKPWERLWHSCNNKWGVKQSRKWYKPIASIQPQVCFLWSVTSLNEELLSTKNKSLHSLLQAASLMGVGGGS